MNLELLTESGFMVDLSSMPLSQSVTEAKADSGMYITLPASRLNKPTANKRIYSTEELSKSLVGCKEAMHGRRLLCSVDDHPQGTHVAPGQASHIVVDAWIEGDILWNKWFVLNTEQGRNLRALIEGRVAIPTSIRGLGRIDEKSHIRDYQYLGTDCVGNPAAGTYALVGSEGVKVEVVESYTSELNKVQEGETSKWSDTDLKNYYSHLSRPGRDLNKIHPKDKEELDRVRAEMNKRGFKTESLQEDRATGIQISGVGTISPSSVIEFRGRTWRVSNIAGSPERWQMTLYDQDPMNQNSTHVFSDDVKDPRQEIKIVRESGVKMSPRYNEWMSKISEASKKLQAIRMEANQKKELSHIASFEYQLSEADITGDELKSLQEAWDNEKKRPALEIEKTVVDVPVALRVNSLEESIKAILSKLDVLKKDDSDKAVVSEEEQKMAVVMKSAPYSFDDGAVRTGYEAWHMHKDDPKNFVLEMKSQLGGRYPGVDFRSLFNDLNNASGDFAFTGVPGDKQNIPESVQQEMDELSAIVSEFCDQLESGDLIKAEQVEKIVTEVVETARQSVRKAQIEKELALEMLTDIAIKSSKESKMLETKASKFSNLWEAAEVIIGQLRSALLRKEGRIQTESLAKDKFNKVPGQGFRAKL